MTEFIWNFGLIQACNRGFSVSPEEYFNSEYKFDRKNYLDLREDDIVWIKCEWLADFANSVLSELKVPIRLLIADGDESFPSDCNQDSSNKILENDLITKIFAQNNDSNHPKVTSIPIGLDYHTIAYKGHGIGGWGERGSPVEQEEQLKNLLVTLKPTGERIPRAFVDFHHSDTMRAELKRYLQFGEDRKTIFEYLKTTGLIDHAPFMRRSYLWDKKGEYAFSISPHGNGYDCHRTWEDLILGCIVIVKTSPLDKLYAGLPVVIVNDWTEITSANMEQWLGQYGDAFSNSAYRERLTMNYWLSKL